MAVLRYKVKDGERVLGYSSGAIIELEKAVARPFSDKLELVRDSDGVAHTISSEDQLVRFVLPASIAAKLEAAGYARCREVASLTDADLLAIDGIGAGKLAAIRGIVGGGEPLPDDPESAPDESEIKIVEFEVE